MIFNSGGMLTGAEIEKQIRKGNISINPYNADQLNPNSYNMKLHPKLLIYKRNSYNNRENTRQLTDWETTETEQTCFGGLDASLDSNESKINIYTKKTEQTCFGGDTSIDSNESKINRYSNVTPIMRDIDTFHNISIIESCKLDPLDALKDNETVSFNIPKEGYVLQPGVLYIGRTVETTATDKYIPMINGRSSGGRLGISIHICAGFGDIGFDGTWTLEITCVEPVRIYPYMELAQVCFFKPEGKIKNLYRGRYFRQEEPTPSRMWKGKITG